MSTKGKLKRYYTVHVQDKDIRTFVWNRVMRDRAARVVYLVTGHLQVMIVAFFWRETGSWKIVHWRAVAALQTFDSKGSDAGAGAREILFSERTVLCIPFAPGYRISLVEKEEYHHIMLLPSCVLTVTTTYHKFVISLGQSSMPKYLQVRGEAQLWGRGQCCYL